VLDLELNFLKALKSIFNFLAIVVASRSRAGKNVDGFATAQRWNRWSWLVRENQSHATGLTALVVLVKESLAATHVLVGYGWIDIVERNPTNDWKVVGWQDDVGLTNVGRRRHEFALLTRVTG